MGGRLSGIVIARPVAYLGESDGFPPRPGNRAERDHVETPPRPQFRQAGVLAQAKRGIGVHADVIQRVPPTDEGRDGPITR